MSETSNKELLTQNVLWKHLAAVLLNDRRYHWLKAAKIAADVVLKKRYDPLIPLLPQILAKEIPTILDVGANMGQFAARLCRLFPEGDVYSFEPVLYNFEGLEKTMAWLRLKNLHLSRVALCDIVGVESMHVPVFNDTFRDGALAVLERSKREFQNVTYVAEEVRTDTIDSVCERLGLRRIDFLKVDTEGAEERVIAGGWQVIERDLPVMYVESSWHASWLERLYDQNFLPFYVRDDGLHEPKEDECQTNTLLVHESKSDVVSKLLKTRP